MGWAGIGNFLQSGGTNNCINECEIGSLAGSSGTYSLSGSGYATVAGNQYVGYSGSGTYSLSGSGYLTVAANEDVGYYATGTFLQTGGTNSIGDWLYLGTVSGGSGAVQPQQRLFGGGERQREPP